MIKPVANIKEGRKEVTKNPGIYWWWFREECVEKLLRKISNIDYSHIRKDRITINKRGIGHFTEDGDLYFALYVGESKNLRYRIYTHLSEGETVHSLHMVIGGLLSDEIPLKPAEITRFLCDNCVLQWEWTTCKAKAEARETKELSIAYYPLNQDKNILADSETKKTITDIRGIYKK